MVSPTITKLGLLSETNIDVTSIQEQPMYVTFAHKMMHEFAAAQFIANTLNDAKNVTVSIYNINVLRITVFQYKI